MIGAGNSVGLLVFKKLLKKKSFEPVGIVRDRKGYNTLIRLGASPEQIKICDIRFKESLEGVFEGATKAVLATSARPKKTLGYAVSDFFRKLIGKSDPPSGSDLYYPDKQSPYDVDFIGQKNVIDACMAASVEHIVMLGNMGGYRNSKLNDIGRKPSDTGNPKVGNLLKWKRAAERYLMKRCFFTIVHSGILIDEPGGQREIVWDTDDALLRTNYRVIPKEDVADVLIQSLIWKEAVGRSIDIGSLPPTSTAGGTDTVSAKGVTKHSTDWLRFWSRPGNCAYPADYDEISE